MADNRKKRLKKQKRRQRGVPPPLPAGLALGFALVGALFAALQPEQPPIDDVARQLPPPTDDLVLNPETGNYE